MVNEKAAGVVCFRIHPKDGLQYLILYMRGMYWNFPKGKVDEGYNDEQTAIKELEEETGISGVELVKDWQQETEFFFKEDRDGKKELIKKTMAVFLAPVPEDTKVNITNNPANHKTEVINGYAWMEYKIASKYLRFKNLKSILAEAHSYVTSKIEEAKNSPRGI